MGPRGGILRRGFGERVLRPAATRAGLDGLTFHGLRHAAATPLVDVGVHPRVMAARIGHGTVKTTMEVYARASYSADREAALLLQERFCQGLRREQRRPRSVGQVRDPDVTQRAENPGHGGSPPVTSGHIKMGSDQGGCGGATWNRTRDLSIFRPDFGLSDRKRICPRPSSTVLDEYLLPTNTASGYLFSPFPVALRVSV